MTKTIFTLIIVLSCAIGVHAQKTSVFSADGKAIRGYDPVAFFTDSKPVKGYDSLSYDWQDGHWLFSSTSNLEQFKSNPEKYAPAYGGYCAYGTAQGHKAPTETDTWSIVDGKLYFNYNKKVKEAWLKDQAGMIQKADTVWPQIKDKE